ncbi:MAG: Mth938-like domain-containing protein [Pseudomonadota bacterium]
MKLHLTLPDGTNMFTGYGDGYVEVNRQRCEQSLVVLPDRMLSDWSAGGFAGLSAADFEALAALAPEILLLGTGPVLRFPAPAVLRPLIEAGIGAEVMDTQAACRTYNILVAEGRRVAAALLLS